MEFFTNVFHKAKTPLLLAAFVSIIVAYLVKEPIAKAMEMGNSNLSFILFSIFLMFISIIGLAFYINAFNKMTDKDAEIEMEKIKAKKRILILKIQKK